MPRLIYLIICVLILFSGCKCDREKVGKGSPVGEKHGVNIIRFEQEVFKIDANNIVPGLKKLSEKYPDLYPVFINNILAINQKPGDFERYDKIMAEFITNKNMRGLYDTVQHKYPDLGRLEEEFEDAFALYKKEFPKNPTPQVYTIISEFSIGTFTIGKEIIGIGLDLFLGPNYRYYPSVGVPAFLLPKLDKPYILPNAMQVLAAELTTEPVENNTLLAQMIYHGKTLYFAERVLPDTPEERIIGYSKEQLKWCKDNEPQIWGYFIEKQLLYSTRMTDFPKYVEEGPTTTGMPTDAPGKVGAWTGWQIVRAYMENNPDVTLAQLMEDTDNKKIFERSGYKPRKG